MLAGGLGTRLAGVLHDRPKALADIAGRPFLEWQLDYLHACGIRRAVISIGFRGAQIVAALGDRYRDIALDYARESSPLGTGGAIRHALRRIRGNGAFVLNGDTLARYDFDALRGRSGHERFVMAAASTDDAARYGALVVEGDTVVGFVEKGVSGPALINAGAYWVSPDVFGGFDLPQRFSLEDAFLRPFVSRFRPRWVVVRGPMIDIGLPEALEAAQHIVPAMVR